MLLRNGAWAGIAQADQAQDEIFIGRELAPQEVACRLAQELRPRGTPAACQPIERGAHVLWEVDLCSMESRHLLTRQITE